MTIPIDDKHKIAKNFSEENYKMLGFRKFILEDNKKQGKLISDIQDLRKKTALLRFKDQHEAEKFKLQQQIKKRKEMDKIGNR